MTIYVPSFTSGSLCIIVSSVTFLPWPSPFFYSAVIKSSFLVGISRSSASSTMGKQEGDMGKQEGDMYLPPVFPY
jgi:hypothetical protein